MLDIIYNSCKSLGSVFGFGAMEGFIIYFGIVAYAFLKATGSNKDKNIVMARSK
ncbi:hypothetical protein ACV3OB_16350 [Clostridium perfringens]|jgi:hypothetical protein|uniref:hypothetical protein n=1 Tax=Clostridium perfringens TaxID=1502 RepID=UPI0013E294A5|nr:hypothetical protein [Clostridium perfringens]MDM0822041.1 hypothetical protein [Clostridium perfringens]MDM0830963.1 hypothetical protein [Clostridium perfringens]MDU7726727.1 hypothetical protein [Clostridium perfringens]NGT56565.1 hypothetical protein [Clostridium perfringens]NGT56639.1 hypothetical protein [Clostridium perfringens]